MLSQAEASFEDLEAGYVSGASTVSLFRTLGAIGEDSKNFVTRDINDQKYAQKINDGASRHQAALERQLPLLEEKLRKIDILESSIKKQRIQQKKRGCGTLIGIPGIMLLLLCLIASARIHPLKVSRRAILAEAIEACLDFTFNTTNCAAPILLFNNSSIFSTCTNLEVEAGCRSVMEMGQEIIFPQVMTIISIMVLVLVLGVATHSYYQADDLYFFPDMDLHRKVKSMIGEKETLPRSFCAMINALNKTKENVLAEINDLKRTPNTIYAILGSEKQKGPLLKALTDIVCDYAVTGFFKEEKLFSSSQELPKNQVRQRLMPGF